MVTRLASAGHSITVEPGAGTGSGHDDESYRKAGARVEPLSGGDVLVTVEPPAIEAINKVRAVLGFLEPLDRPDAVQELAGSGSTFFAFELLPRTTRAQAMDALSSQATITGYEATLEAARSCDRIFPMLTTAAGTIRPASVLVLGTGVAGLQAVATARRLGAMVAAFDVRAAAAEQAESLGARFLTVDMEPQDASTTGGYAREMPADTEGRVLSALFDEVVAADAVITTAAVPGRPAPRLVSAEMVEGMRPGSAIVDGAASTGGNCDLTRPGATVVERGVTVAGPLDLPSRSANHASQLYSRNVVAFLELLADNEGAIDGSVDDEIIEGTVVARGGSIVHPRLVEPAESSRA
ncbi:Re/Si-specific NAD(P)(+) transhydrogenase subunit alpha [soil metagenome]